MLKGKKILIVDNSRTIRLQIKMMLENEGAILVEVGTEWGMTTKIEEYGVIADLIIMDLILNAEDGLDLIKKLKENVRFKHIPIIIITEKVDVDSILFAKDLGVRSYLKKPFKKSDLVIRIQDALEKTATENFSD
ncbi:MAG: response regulator [Clostridiaceae bacterium]|nr:response regulator [Clostridiaceae bacterium]